MLCKHNPNKRCTGNFAHKYWVGDKLLAKCEGEIQVELTDFLTGEQVKDDLSNTRLEVPNNGPPPVELQAKLWRHQRLVKTCLVDALPLSRAGPGWAESVPHGLRDKKFNGILGRQMSSAGKHSGTPRLHMHAISHLLLLETPAAASRAYVMLAI